ncbi:hypothetical protein ACU6VG_02460 [Sphaerotilus sulfidivorans]
MLVDDHALVRMGFRMLLAESGDIEVVGEADSGEQALARVAEIRPEVVVLEHLDARHGRAGGAAPSACPRRSAAADAVGA